MARGPQLSRLDSGLAPADTQAIAQGGGAGWQRAVAALRATADRLRSAGEQGRTIGGETGEAMWESMNRSADTLEERAEDYRRGVEALMRAGNAVTKAESARQALDLDPSTRPLDHPGGFTADPDASDEDNLRAESEHGAAVSAFEEREALRERRAREIADQLDTDYDEPIAVMKSIHGIPDPEPVGPTPGGGSGGGGGVPPLGGGGGSAGGGAGGAGGAGGGGGSSVDDGSDDHVSDPFLPDGDDDTDVPDDTDTNLPDDLDPDFPGDPDVPTYTPDPDVPVTPGGGGSVGSGGTGGSGGLGAAGGLGVGAAVGGGALLGGGLVKGGGMLAAGSTAGRPIGGLSRSAVSGGSLGRGGAMAGGSPVRGGAAGGTAGRGGTGGRGGAGGRAGAAGATGGRGAGARTGGTAAGARGTGGKDRDKKRGRDAYDDDGKDWLDDEASPGVLD